MERFQIWQYNYKGFVIYDTIKQENIGPFCPTFQKLIQLVCLLNNKHIDDYIPTISYERDRDA